MRMRRSILCILCLSLLVPLALRARGMLPPEPRPLIEAKYGGWSGVLRLWAFEGWQVGAGSASGWLNRCIASFEKAHPGVYVQPEYVDASAISDPGGASAYPPDLLLFPPGLIDDPEALTPLTIDAPLRDGFAGCGRIGETLRAVPVLAGGYLWAYDAGRLDGIPGSWRKAGATISAPPDEPWRQWSAALLALCSARHAPSSPAAANDEAGTLDLGLAPVDTTPTPAPSPEPEELLDCALPPDFSFDAGAWHDFVNGELAAIPVTQREVRRLEALSAQGRGVDWRLAASGDGAFTDQLLCAAIPAALANAAPDADRQALCEAFIAHLLSDDCQGTLASVGAFSVTDAGSGYPAGDSLLALEQALRAPGLAAPGCLDGGWRADAQAIVRKFTDDSASPAALWALLRERIRQESEQ